MNPRNKISPFHSAVMLGSLMAAGAMYGAPMPRLFNPTPPPVPMPPTPAGPDHDQIRLAAAQAKRARKQAKKGN